MAVPLDLLRFVAEKTWAECKPTATPGWYRIPRSHPTTAMLQKGLASEHRREPLFRSPIPRVSLPELLYCCRVLALDEPMGNRIEWDTGSVLVWMVGHLNADQILECNRQEGAGILERLIRVRK